MKLVDVDQAVKQLREECDGCQLNEDQMDRECPTCWVTEAVDALEKLPTVDAVEVVRCAACRHWGVKKGDCVGGYRKCAL